MTMPIEDEKRKQQHRRQQRQERRPTSSSVSWSMKKLKFLSTLMAAVSFQVSAVAAAVGQAGPSSQPRLFGVSRNARRRMIVSSFSTSTSSSSISTSLGEEENAAYSILQRSDAFRLHRRLPSSLSSSFSPSLLVKKISQLQRPLSPSILDAAAAAAASEREQSTLLLVRKLMLDRLRGGATPAAADASSSAAFDDEQVSNENKKKTSPLGAMDKRESGEGDDEDEDGEKSSSSPPTGSSTSESSVASSPPASAASSAAQPVSLTVRTCVNNVVIDATLEITVLSTRNVAAIKERLRRVIPGKPPLSTISLLFQGQPLDDEQTVQDLLQELAEDEPDDDDEESDDIDKESDDSSRSIVLTLDMLPPVDPKFFAQVDEKMPDLTTSQLLDAYAMNEAVLYHNAALLRHEQLQQAAATLAAAQQHQQQELTERDDMEEQEHSEKDKESTLDGILLASHETQQRRAKRPIHLQLQQEAARIRQDLELLLVQKDPDSSSSSSSSPQQQPRAGSSSSSKVAELLNDVETPAVKAKMQAAHPIQKRGHRVRHHAAITSTTSSSSSYTSLRRMIQTNLNVQWGDTMRYFVLFIFFGYFGGRTPASRAILLLGAPSVFVLQARPVKLLLKQVLYTILDHPYGILLSLLPAPQQAILSLNHAEAMQTIYGIPAPAAGKAAKHGTKRVARKAIASKSDADDQEDELGRQEQFLDKMRGNDDDDESDEEFFDAREEDEEEESEDEDDE